MKREAGVGSEILVDPEALRRKYREERDKRLRPDGATQYLSAEGDLAHFRDDIYAEPLAREPVEVDVGVAIIGGGFSGLLASANLHKRGVEDFCIIEEASDFGGTWYWNRYPGLACDVESYCYLPLLEDVGYIPSQKYVPGQEIFEHCQRLGHHFDLYRRAYFQTTVTSVAWDEESARWIVKTNRNDVFRARFLIRGGGGLNKPKLPGVPGIAKFKGHSFHTIRWDYEYTGGGPTGNLVRLKDKKVAIIGTGATAIQCIPHLGAWAKQLYVFQRTPSSINVRANRPTDSEWARSLTSGWQKQRMTNFESIVGGIYQEQDLVADGWTDIFSTVFHFAAGDKSKLTPADVLQMADFQKMEANRQRIDEIVKDPETAEALKPWYNMMCKRPCFSDEYLDTFNRDNVKLVDTQGKGVQEITENAVVVDGQAYEVDCIVYATGFGYGVSNEDQMGYEVYGRGGLTLPEYWANGLKTLHGIHTHNFPNYFVTFGVQGPLSINLPFALEAQAEVIAEIIADCTKNKVKTFEVSPEGEARWQEELRDKAFSRAKFYEECTPSYYNAEGTSIGFLDLFYFGGPVVYREVVRDWLNNGGIERDIKRAFLDDNQHAPNHAVAEG